MTQPLVRLRDLAAATVLAALPLAALAQLSDRNRQAPTQAELLRQGDLVGGRPHASAPRTARLAAAPAAATGTADPVLARLLHENVDVNRLPASQLPGLYDRILDVMHAERRQWTDRDWTDASAVFSRLNARYETVRLELPLNERLNVRTAQGEFRTLEAAHNRQASR